MMANPIDEWLDEPELYGIRRERLFSDMQGWDWPTLTAWLKAAYDLGYEKAADEAAEEAAGDSM